MTGSSGGPRERQALDHLPGSTWSFGSYLACDGKLLEAFNQGTEVTRFVS